jgi:hypothetical protein
VRRPTVLNLPLQLVFPALTITIKNAIFSIMTLNPQRCYAECRYAECRGAVYHYLTKSPVPVISDVTPVHDFSKEIPKKFINIWRHDYNPNGIAAFRSR